MKAAIFYSTLNIKPVVVFLLKKSLKDNFI